MLLIILDSNWIQHQFMEKVCYILIIVARSELLEDPSLIDLETFGVARWGASDNFQKNGGGVPPLVPTALGLIGNNL